METIKNKAKMLGVWTLILGVISVLVFTALFSIEKIRAQGHLDNFSFAIKCDGECTLNANATFPSIDGFLNAISGLPSLLDQSDDSAFLGAIGTRNIENYVPVVRLNDGLYTEKTIQTTLDIVYGATSTANGRSCVSRQDSFIDASTTIFAIYNNFNAPAVMTSFAVEITGAATSSIDLGVGTSTSPHTVGGFNPSIISLNTGNGTTTLLTGNSIATGTLPVVVMGYGQDSQIPNYPEPGASQVYIHPVASIATSSESLVSGVNSQVPILAGEYTLGVVTTAGTAFNVLNESAVITNESGGDEGVTGVGNTFAGTYSYQYCEI